MKIWGLDFGDCHRSLFAHDDRSVKSYSISGLWDILSPRFCDPARIILSGIKWWEVCSVSQLGEFDWAFFPSSVMYLQFVAKSHLFFTAGKDSKIKQWDADKFEHIQTLEVGSFRECWQEALCLHEQYFTQGLGAGWYSCLTSVHHAGASPGGVVFGTESQWRLRGVSIPRQVPTPLGEDKGATYFGRGEGDGESCILHAKDYFQTCFLPSRQHFSFFTAEESGSMLGRLARYYPQAGVVVPRVDWHLLHDETVAVSCLEMAPQMLLVLFCLYCIADVCLTLLCFPSVSQAFLCRSAGYILWASLKLLCSFQLKCALEPVQQVAVVEWWRVLLLLNAVCLDFPFFNCERSILSW